MARYVLFKQQNCIFIQQKSLSILLDGAYMQKFVADTELIVACTAQPVLLTRHFSELPLLPGSNYY
jgi:hypothetical protein